MLSISDVRVPPTWQSLLVYDMSFSNVYCNNNRFSTNGKFFLEQREKNHLKSQFRWTWSTEKDKKMKKTCKQVVKQSESFL